MSESHVVDGTSVRLPLSDGGWIDVKRELNAGEYFDLLTDLSARKAFSKILAYVVGWSLVGLDGKPLPWDLDGDEALRRTTVRSLNKRIVRELIATIDRHEAAEDAAVEAKKKTPGVARESSAISPSVAP